MKVVVAGASSVLGVPVVKSLVGRGHEVVALTRDSRCGATLRDLGASVRAVDVFRAADIARVLRDEAPDAVISLLIQLPKYGPRRLRDFRATERLWIEGVPHLLEAAQQAGVARFVAESMVFAYGYARFERELTESDLYPGPAPLGKAGEPMLCAMRTMEQRVLESTSNSSTTGVVLRYGILHGDRVVHTRYMTMLAKLWLMPVPTGDAVLPWIELNDAAEATVDAALSDQACGVYNVVDDEPVTFRHYMNGLAAALGRPKPWSIPRRVLGTIAPYAALAFGDVELPVSNAKAKHDLDWDPTYRRPADLFRRTRGEGDARWYPTPTVTKAVDT